MLFDKNSQRANDVVLYKTKPNMILGCKKALIGVILLALVFVISPRIIQFIGEMQVYLISYIKLPLTRYAAIAFFVVILIIIVYIIWQLIGWYSMEYTLTDTRIIIKSGVLSTKKNYMPYSTIQDINTSQGIFARMLNVGTVSAFSAYDNNQIKLENISDPSKVEDIIFSNMMGYRNVQQSQREYIPHASAQRHFIENDGHDEYFEEEYYDEYEPITPINREREQFQRREYEYYPEDFAEEKKYPSYEYEPYGDGFDYNMNRAMNTMNEGHPRNIRSQSQYGEVYEGQPRNIRGNPHYGERYDNAANDFDEGTYYDEDRVNYSPRSDNYYQNNESESYYDEVKDYSHQVEPDEVDEIDDSGESAIRRHFDKFKK